MNQVQRKKLLRAPLLIGGLMLCVQPVTSSGASHNSEAPPNVEVPPGKESVGNKGQTMTQNNGDQEAYAKRLAEALARAGATMSPSDLSQLNEALHKGGSAAMALAQYLVAALAEIESPSSSNENSGTPASLANAREAQLDQMIARVSEGKYADLAVAHIVQPKLIKLRRKR